MNEKLSINTCIGHMKYDNSIGVILFVFLKKLLYDEIS